MERGGWNIRPCYHQVLDKTQEMTQGNGIAKVILAAFLPKLAISSEVLTSSAAIPAPVPEDGRSLQPAALMRPRWAAATLAEAVDGVATGRLLEGHDAR